MNRFTRAFVCLIAGVMAFLAVTPAAFAATSYKVINITQEQMDDDAYTWIESALREARFEATDSKPYKIVVPSGNYELISGLHIFSNTYLQLAPDTYFIRTFESGNMIKSGVKEDSFSKYDGYKNIKIEGGIWDSDNLGESCAFRFAHCKNVELKNVTVKNVRNSHHFEAAAIDGLKINGCKFSGYQRSKNVTGEAVQLDVIHNEEHFPAYAQYDDTPCKNVTVSGCSFSNLFSGLGTRAGVVGSYFDNVVIKENKFDNIVDKAISGFNWKNCTIKDNTITNSSVGIFFEYFPAANLSTKLYMPNDKSKKIKLNTDSKTVIKDNTITVKTRSSYNKTSGISVYGGKLTNSGSIHNGNYYVNNMIIKNNTITLDTATGVGIYSAYMFDSTVKSNKITAKKSAKSGTNAINQSNGKNNTYKSNKISGKFNNGFSFYNSAKKNTLAANSVSGAKEHAVYCENGSSLVINVDNKYDGIGKSIISVNKKTVENPQKPTLKSIKLNGKKPKITWEKVDGASGYEVYRATSKKGTYTLVATVKKGKTTSYTDKSAKKGKTCYYKIKAYKKSSGSYLYSAFSSKKSIKSK